MLPTTLLLVLVFLIVGLPVQATATNVYDDLIASSSNKTRQMLDYTRFLGSDSRVPDHLKRAIQIVEKHDTLPSCGKMAVSALMYSCATLEGKSSAESEHQGESQAPDVDLGAEKVLYATRLAVCELSESKAYVPRECKSFIPTKENTKKTGFLGYITGNGPPKPIVSYPKYEEATNQDLDICLGALQNSAQTWTSYSNARQDAVNLCHAVRGDIEKDEILHLHKILTENTASNAEALRLMRENAEETREAFHHLVVNMRQFSVDIHEGNTEAQARFVQMWNDVEHNVRAGMHDLASLVDQITSKMNDNDVQVRISAQHVHGVISEIATRFNGVIQQHESTLALASKDAANAHEHLTFANEILQQQMMSALSVAVSKMQSVGAFSGQALENVKMMKNESQIANEQVEVLVQRLLDTMGVVQQLADGHEDIRASVNATRDSIANLKSEVLAISGSISAIIGTIMGAFGHLPAVAWYLFYLAIAAAILFFITLFPGGSLLLRSCARLARYVTTVSGNNLCTLGRLALSASSAAAHHALGLTAMFVIVAAALHFRTIASAVFSAIQRLSDDKETAFCFGVACGVVVFVAFVITLATYHFRSKSITDSDEQQFEARPKYQRTGPGLAINDPKYYEYKKWAAGV
ncbi:hypothetical protein Q7P37_000481 [Cladosporium fusiforme]